MSKSTNPGTQASRCRDVGLAIGWIHPFFLIPLSYLRFEETDKIPTAAVYDSGLVLVNPKFAAGISDRQLAGVVCHEIMHLLLQHSGRKGSRDHLKWNIATDLAINSALRQMSIELPEGALYPPHGAEGTTAEEFYDKLPPMPPDAGKGGVGRGCGVEKDPNGQSGAGEGEGDEEGEGAGGKAPAPGQVDWEVVAHQAQASARGTESAKAVAPLLSRKESAIRWKNLLRSTFNRVAASGGRDMQTMSRRNRRSPDGIILPGWISYRPTVAIVIDSSGSMSNAMLARAVAEAQAAGEAAGARVFLALHAAHCYWHGWIDVKGAPDKLGRLMTYRGGTDAREAYERVGEERAKFDTMIHLTDCELGTWPALPENVRRLVVGQIGGGRYASKPPEGKSTVIKVECGED